MFVGKVTVCERILRFFRRQASIFFLRGVFFEWTRRRPRTCYRSVVLTAFKFIKVQEFDDRVLNITLALVYSLVELIFVHRIGLKLILWGSQIIGVLRFEWLECREPPQPCFFVSKNLLPCQLWKLLRFNRFPFFLHLVQGHFCQNE